ncbi:helix-turn-helix protein [Kribbella amoyensis]|uniref:Helix-turn-helix protein n=1 Tax=Kribbella amoyensis TaxID=996641 RepID=A0A561C0P2_9ACTN|nr:winged helix-turn-helix domain-containing protein [Kribbella amoyensis]TWD84617.1 helix-turn-helix protein [Kribbella amoyensis]
MIEYELAHGDLTATRFAISPLNETVLSLRAVQNPARYPLHRAWLRTLPDLGDLPDLALLLSLLTRRGWSPDFLTPVPPDPTVTFADELARMAATPAEQVRADLARLPGIVLSEEPGVLLRRVATALDAYWAVAVEPSWPRMRMLLEADISYRSRVSSAAGLQAMLTGLSDRITFEPPVIRIAIPQAPARYVRTDGRGLALMPSLFALHTAAPVDPAGPPMIVYAARGVATLWERRPAVPPDALAAVLGTVRAGLLARLAEPASSTELALDLGVTTSAVNQHLRALRNVGLLESARSGRSVRYRRTALADQLLQHAGE